MGGLASPLLIPNFQEWCAQHTAGHGVWKWSNALDAYSRHFAVYKGHALSVVEVGVQSGGSIDMWHSVLGPNCIVHGIDINNQTLRFVNTQTTITIGDQASTVMWDEFYKNRPNLDILIDDGGHEPNQMLVTLEQGLNHVSPGGFVVIEDIHGGHYVDSFFRPAAKLIASQVQRGRVDAVHVYPFLLVTQAAGYSVSLGTRSELSFHGVPMYVSNFEELWRAVQATASITPHVGGHIILENLAWGPFLTEAGLTNFFVVFGDLHAYKPVDNPPGCATTPAPQCTNSNSNSVIQAQITGVHIYPMRLIVEVARDPVAIEAVRHGAEWLHY